MRLFSDKSYGDMLDPRCRQNFLTAIGVNPGDLIWQTQIHGSVLAKVTQKDCGREIPGVDGLVCRQEAGQQVFLSVHVADCVPVLFVDDENAIVAAVHAGWKGTLDHIVAKTVFAMTSFGANISSIKVSIGPHIAGCCYQVPVERAGKFLSEYPDQRVAFPDTNGWRVDIGMANYLDLLNSGVLECNIDSPVCCTACQADRFFSYRREGNPLQEIMGVVGLD